MLFVVLCGKFLDFTVSGGVVLVAGLLRLGLCYFALRRGLGDLGLLGVVDLFVVYFDLESD